MFHSALCWLEHTKLKLWPLAVNHAAHLHNEMIQMDNGFAPIELWSKAKSSFSAIKNAHTWGCPVFVLDPKLQNGQKIPKWQPRSRMGQYVGASPYHASSVGLVRNLRTNNISPQFHLVYDDFFETVHSSDVTQPAVWEELVIFSRQQANYDIEDVPELAKEWLNPEELAEKYKVDDNKRGSKNSIPVEERSSLDSSMSTSQKKESLGSGGRPVRCRRAPDRYTFDGQHGYKTIKAYCSRIYKGIKAKNG